MSWRRFAMREALCRFVDLGEAIAAERAHAADVADGIAYADPQLATLLARNVGTAYGRARCWLEYAEHDESINASIERLERNEREFRRAS